MPAGSGTQLCGCATVFAVFFLNSWIFAGGHRYTGNLFAWCKNPNLEKNKFHIVDCAQCNIFKFHFFFYLCFNPTSMSFRKFGTQFISMHESTSKWEGNGNRQTLKECLLRFTKKKKTMEKNVDERSVLNVYLFVNLVLRLYTIHLRVYVCIVHGRTCHCHRHSRLPILTIWYCCCPCC